MGPARVAGVEYQRRALQRRSAENTTDVDNNPKINPTIKCDCFYNNNTVCHITKLKVYALNVVSQIPDELQNLTYLNNLNLMQNYLTGPVLSFIGKFPMQYLSLAINPLSGTLPKELGDLTSLITLGISLNNYTGELPSELGNLAKLEQIYFDSSGFSGPFPSTFSKRSYGHRDFTGKIPDFIGSLTNLEDLILGNCPIELLCICSFHLHKHKNYLTFHSLFCTQGSPHQRPPMSRVVKMLTGDIEMTEVVTKPSYITEWQRRGGNTSYVTSSDSSGDTTGEFNAQREMARSPHHRR
ncbi:hypothetical protein U9M48_040503 [Paspalum notatum var. saurae]|uniref:Uncharacterized protein n=1 Tax=Paspalum notatum var. saurae TaxID=547442 RepID=A0AAQ3ULV3_PASNO